MSFQRLFSLSAQQSNRLAWMDYAKGIAIIMVVYRHITIGMQLGGITIDPFVFELADNVGLTLRMPLFFLLSGIFFRKSILKRSESGYVLHKTKTIIYPYLIWAFIVTSLQLVMSRYVNADVSWWSYLDIFIAPSGHWWFLVALFNVSVLYLVLFLLTRGNHLLLLLAGLVMFYVAPHVEYFSFHHHIFRLFIFFVLGDIVSKYILDKKNRALLTSGWLLLVFVAGTIAGEWILFQDVWRESTSLHLLFPIIGSCAIIWISNQLTLHNHRLVSVIRTIGQHSLYVYLLHSLFGAAIRIGMVALGFSNYWVIMPVSILAAIILPIYVYRLCKRYGLWFLFTPEAPATAKTHQEAPVANPAASRTDTETVTGSLGAAAKSSMANS